MRSADRSRAVWSRGSCSRRCGGGHRSGGRPSGCGSGLSAGLAGRSLAPGTVTYWNLFGGGDGGRMQSMQQTSTKPARARVAAGGDLRVGQPVLHEGVPGDARRRPARRGRRPPNPPVEPRAGEPPHRGHRRRPGSGRAEGERLRAQGLGRAPVDGKRYAIPIDTHPFVLYYNVDVCEKAGLLDGEATSRRSAAPRRGRPRSRGQEGDRRVGRVGRDHRRQRDELALVPGALLAAAGCDALPRRGRPAADVQRGPGDQDAGVHQSLTKQV